jgi:hypothetical protein
VLCDTDQRATFTLPLAVRAYRRATIGTDRGARGGRMITRAHSDTYLRVGRTDDVLTRRIIRMADKD